MGCTVSEHVYDDTLVHDDDGINECGAALLVNDHFIDFPFSIFANVVLPNLPIRDKRSLHTPDQYIFVTIALQGGSCLSILLLKSMDEIAATKWIK